MIKICKFFSDFDIKLIQDILYATSSNFIGLIVWDLRSDSLVNEESVIDTCVYLDRIDIFWSLITCI